MVNRPLVSIACITYNHVKFISQAIEGFLRQETAFPIEIIIHDDASTDGTAAIVQDYASKHAHILPILQTENQYSQGIKPSTTHVLPRCRGKYVALCEGDDYWIDPLKLQKQVNLLEQRSDYAMCFTNSSIVDENSQIVRASRLEKERRRDLSQRDVVSGLVPPTNTIMMRNIIQDAYATFPNIVNGDILISALLAEHGQAGYIGDVTACYRIHPQGLWSSQSLKFQMVHYLRTYLVLLDRFKDKYEDILLQAIGSGYENLLACYQK